MNLVSLLIERAEENPERPALVETRDGKDRMIRYGELAARVAGGAEFLRKRDLRRGEVIWLMQPVSITLYEWMLSAFHAGLRVMLADPHAGREFLDHCVALARPVAYAGPWQAHALRWKTPALRSIRVALRGEGWFPGTCRWRPLAGKSPPPEELPADEPALITFTSGSTGMPKGAVRGHGLLLAQHQALIEPLALEAGEVDLVTLPVFVLANLASGMTSVLAAGTTTAAAAAISGQCHRWQVTRCTAAPAFFESLMAAPGGIPDFKRIFTGGGPVFPDFLRRLSGRLPAAEIHAVYGSTEAEPIADAPLAMADGRDGRSRDGAGLAAGRPAHGTDVRVIPTAWGKPLGPYSAGDFDALCLPPGRCGEIVVAGDHVVPGYLRGAGDAETKIRAGGRIFHRTGDAGWFDAEGTLWLLGRSGVTLPDPASPVSVAAGLPPAVVRHPFAIECALRERFPQVKTAAIEWHGKRLLAAAAPTDEVDWNAFNLAAQSWAIDRIVQLPHLPLDQRHRSKIDYPALHRVIEVAIGRGIC